MCSRFSRKPRKSWVKITRKRGQPAPFERPADSGGGYPRAVLRFAQDSLDRRQPRNDKGTFFFALICVWNPDSTFSFFLWIILCGTSLEYVFRIVVKENNRSTFSWGITSIGACTRWKWCCFYWAWKSTTREPSCFCGATTSAGKWPFPLPFGKRQFWNMTRRCSRLFARYSIICRWAVSSTGSSSPCMRAFPLNSSRSPIWTKSTASMVHNDFHILLLFLHISINFFLRYISSFSSI